MRRMVLLLLVNLLLITSLVAQSPNGTISGIVHDPSGAVIAGAEIIIVNDATGVQSSTTTNGEGIYVVPSLPPGSYRLQVSKIGFKTLIKPDIVLSVQDALAVNFTLPVGAASETVTVQGGAPLVSSQDAAVSTVIDRNFVESLPLNGRSFNTLLQLTPGVVIAPAQSTPGQFSIAGQRTTANNFLVDGVSANFGVSPYLGLSGTGTGTVQAFSALGATSSLISVDDLREFRIETSSFAAEFGRSPGGQVELTTRSGTNQFHGEVFDYFRNDVMDANDWFANRAGLARAPERHNDFGGVFGGPIVKDRTFFFLSYEGARLRLPKSESIEVPSENARARAPSGLSPFLNAFSTPNGPVSPDGYTAGFTGSYSDRATQDAGSLRIDHKLNNRFTVFERFNDAPSQIATPLTGVSSLLLTNVNTQTFTLGADMTLTSRMVNSMRGNYSRQSSSLAYSANSGQAYGAVPLNPSLLESPLASDGVLTSFNTYDTGYSYVGPDGKNQATQVEFADDLAMSRRTHQLKFGEDYRVILLDENPANYIISATANSVQSLLTTGQAALSASQYLPSQFLNQSLSLYGQDAWQATKRLVLTYGLRWELSPAPSARGKTTLAAWQDTNDPSNITLSSAGHPLWSTTYSNFAPRVGLAYRLTSNGNFVLRAGGGIFYDLGLGAASDLGYSFPNSANSFSSSVPLPVPNVTPYLPTISSQPPFGGVVTGFSPSLALPRSYQWNLALEKSLGGSQTISATYVGQAGRDLLRQSALYQPNANFSGDFLLTDNSAWSNYDALQVQYRRPLSAGLQALFNYSWSHSLDNASNDVIAALPANIISAANDYGSSNFDVRQSFSGAFTYAIPAVTRSKPINLLSRDWAIDSVLTFRTGFPFNGVVIFASPDPGLSAESRPDVVAGQPFWVSNSGAPGGKILNANAFSIPAMPRQGNEARNDIPGFGMAQVDLSVSRKFPVSERINLQLRMDAFNLFNHPNFTNPAAFVEFGAPFLQSTEMLNRGLGGLNSLFQEGGPRSLQLSLKLSF